MNKIFPASLSNLYEMLHFIRDEATLAGLQEPLRAKIELACEEALVNIISYGYPIRRGDIQIETSFDKENGFKIVLVDQGIPYNPVSTIQKGNLKGDPGGYGVFLITNLVDKIDYKRHENSNFLTLTVYRR